LDTKLPLDGKGAFRCSSAFAKPRYTFVKDVFSNPKRSRQQRAPVESDSQRSVRRPLAKLALGGVEAEKGLALFLQIQSVTRNETEILRVGAEKPFFTLVPL